MSTKDEIVKKFSAVTWQKDSRGDLSTQVELSQADAKLFGTWLHTNKNIQLKTYPVPGKNGLRVAEVGYNHAQQFKEFMGEGLQIVDEKNKSPQR